MNITIHTSDEVLDNLEFVRNNPLNSRLADTGLVPCQADLNCSHRLEVYATNVDYTTWYCPEHYNLAPWAND